MLILRWSGRFACRRGFSVARWGFWECAVDAEADNTACRRGFKCGGQFFTGAVNSNFFSSLEALIYSDDFRNKHRLNSAFFTRDRKLSFAGIILFLLRLPQKTLSIEMSDYVSDFLSNTKIKRISKQAFSKAHQKVSPLSFAEILDFTYQYLRQFPARNSSWHGYTVKAIDGTTFRIPNTQENRDYFQTQKNQHGEVALMKVSCLYNVSAELMEKAVLGKCRDSERAQALELLTHDVFHDFF